MDVVYPLRGGTEQALSEMARNIKAALSVQKTFERGTPSRIPGSFDMSRTASSQLRLNPSGYLKLVQSAGTSLSSKNFG